MAMGLKRQSVKQKKLIRELYMDGLLEYRVLEDGTLEYWPTKYCDDLLALLKPL
jgi:hypothetical protein